MERRNNPKKAVKNGLILTSAASQMGLTIYLFVTLGKWLDSRYHTDEKYYLILATLLGVGISLYLVLRLLKKINDP